MQLVKTNKRAGKTLLITIFDLYTQYITNGYPKDPKVYFICANKETLPEVKLLIKLFEVSGKPVKFTVKQDDSLKKGQVSFGPETFLILWDGA